MPGLTRYYRTMSEILQRKLPYDPLSPRPLPGIGPLADRDWLRIDEAYGEQMAEKARLLARDRGKVLAMDEDARSAAEELLAEVVEALCEHHGCQRAGDRITRPDGVQVRCDDADPMATLAQLTQEDFCILEKHGDEHVMTAAALCFPASWSLDEKFMHPLIGIHTTVDEYDAGLARRVQRLFDGVQVGRPMWRFNALWYADAALHQPRRTTDRRVQQDPARANFMRSELQTIRRLAKTGAVVFGIHTYVLARADVEAMTEEEQAQQ